MNPTVISGIDRDRCGCIPLVVVYVETEEVAIAITSKRKQTAFGAGCGSAITLVNKLQSVAIARINLITWYVGEGIVPGVSRNVVGP